MWTYSVSSSVIPRHILHILTQFKSDLKIKNPVRTLGDLFNLMSAKKKPQNDQTAS